MQLRFGWASLAGLAHTDRALAANNRCIVEQAANSAACGAGLRGLQATPISGGVAVTNADPNGTGFAFPGLANTGPGSFAFTNGKRFFFQTGAAYGSPGANGAELTIADQEP